ncbi:MAG TPA: VWA domain-containing protein [Thermoanaerobaculia bacterium]|nr:VWA domain-containing protein [Thermoanaerobaculia bacterium]
MSRVRHNQEVLPHRRLSLAACPALLFLAFAAPVLAAPQPIAEQGFEETSQVVAVEVPVNVVDRDGKPVRGLTADDFEVYDLGNRQKITGFEAVDLTVRQSGPDSPVEEESILPQGRRHLLLLFDLSFSTPTATLKARLAARDFLLNALHPTDLAAVATYSVEHGPQLVVTFTPDRAQLARAIDTLGMKRAYKDGFRQDPLRFMVEAPNTAQVDIATTGGRGADLRAQQEQASQDYLASITNVAERDERIAERSRITTFTKALSAMAKTLNSVAGRKHVILFSEGFDSKLLVGRTDTGGDEAQADDLNAFRGRLWMNDNDQRYGNTELQGDVNRMLEEFKRADCVIQAVDIGGLRTTAEAGGRQRASGQEALFYMANETGGVLFKDTNNLSDQLASVLERTSITYLLTFERSDLKQNGSYHRLRVKAKLPPGARLSHRAGYYEPRPFKDLDPLEKSLLASGGIVNAAPRRDLEMNLLVAPFRSNEKMSYIPVIIEVPGRKLLEGHEGDKLNVEFYAYVNDRLGTMLDYFSEVVSMNLGRGRLGIQEGGIKYYGHFDLPPGDYRVRVLVRNADSGRTVVTMASLLVPTYNLADPVLLPPFFMEEQRSWVLIRESAEVAGHKSVVYPFTVNGEPYVPSAKPILRSEDQARLCLVAYNLGSGAVSVNAQITGADGKALPGGKIALLERTATGIAGVDKLLATFQPTGLTAGDYVLQVGITDLVTGSREVNSLPFQVIQR